MSRSDYYAKVYIFLYYKFLSKPFLEKASLCTKKYIIMMLILLTLKRILNPNQKLVLGHNIYYQLNICNENNMSQVLTQISQFIWPEKMTLPIAFEFQVRSVIAMVLIVLGVTTSSLLLGNLINCDGSDHYSESFKNNYRWGVKTIYKM